MADAAPLAELRVADAGLEITDATVRRLLAAGQRMDV
jgi:hypothetical protein